MSHDKRGNRVDPSTLSKAEKQSPGKTYLGDGLYASFDGFQAVVTAEDGTKATDTIYIEPTVATALARFLRSVGMNID